jgi:hypothetical protein
MADVITLGWRERLALPEFGVVGMRVKLDTGARSSSLNVHALEDFQRDGVTWLRFDIGLHRRSGNVSLHCEAPAIDRRVVMDTGGNRSERWFVRSDVLLAGQRFAVDISLTDRRHMLFPMLLGRTALVGRFKVDPALSYTRLRQTSAVTDVL